MLTAFKNLLQPPVFEDVEQNRLGGLLHTITLGAWLVIATMAAVTFIIPALAVRSIPAAMALFIINALATYLTRKGYARAASLTLVFALIAVVTYISISFVAQPRPYILFFGWIIVFTGLILGRKAATGTAIYFAILQVSLILLADRGVIEPVDAQSSPAGNALVFVVGFLLISSTINLASKNIQNLNEQGKRNELELEQNNKELLELTNSLEQRILYRTRELENANVRIEKRAKQFQTISQASRVIISTKDLEELLPQITQVISQQFGFYHVGVFLVDLNKEYAVLRAANSAGGARMLARTHKLKIGQTGIVGDVAKTGKVRIALDTGADAAYFNNPDLPETRSEMALPLLQANGEIIGVLDIQSAMPKAFYQEDIEILTTLADQVSIAIDNARLFEGTRKAILESEAVYRRDLKTGWKKYSRAQKLAGIHRSGSRTIFLSEPVHIPGANEVIRSGNVYREKEENTSSANLTIPMNLRGEIVGVLNVKTDDEREWSNDEMDIINAIMERAALSIENARLLEESRKNAEREHAIGEISAKISSGTEIETILKTAVRELGSQINGAQITIEIGSGEK
ncbi:MAG: GAF domain-containing protein [Anaerolineales bacterium]|jgi:GAF domain-containing protein|nr:GAF domain-containing protein [Anaerolineales bacterium]